MAAVIHTEALLREAAESGDYVETTGVAVARRAAAKAFAELSEFPSMGPSAEGAQP